MRLTVLVDNNTYTGRYFLGEPGVSFLIEDKGVKILFDVGYTDIFISNAQKMNLSLLDVDCIAISHGHYDHTGGLVPLIRHYANAMMQRIPYKKPSLVSHPKAFMPKMHNTSGDIGSLLSAMKLSTHFNLDLNRKPVELSKNITFLGEIPRNNSWEGKSSLGKVIIDNEEEDDFVTDDSALACKTSKGLVIVSGCSHSGICNIVEYAKAVCGDDRIVDIVGGFHLQGAKGELLTKTLEYMRQLKPEALHACHCTDLQAKIALASVANLKEVGVGLKLQYE